MHYRIFALCCVMYFTPLAIRSAQASFIFNEGFDSDIPGDGSIRCPDKISCNPTSIGTVSSSLLGLLTGTLQAGGSSLTVQIGQTPGFLIFSDGPNSDQALGPLGLNTLYNPIATKDANLDATRDVTIPVSGQKLTLTVVNTGPAPLTGLAFYLETTPTLLIANFIPQADGLSFGIYCTGQIDNNACNTSHPENFQLLGPPSGPGVLNSNDLTAMTPTFGDLLRFTNLNIAPGQSGAFSFFLTDYKDTHDFINTGGKNASSSFALELVPTSGIPEPATAVSVIAGLLLFAASARKRGRQPTCRCAEPSLATADRRVSSQIWDRV